MLLGMSGYPAAPYPEAHQTRDVNRDLEYLKGWRSPVVFGIFLCQKRGSEVSWLLSR
jgi:hypothetical protein